MCDIVFCHPGCVVLVVVGPSFAKKDLFASGEVGAKLREEGDRRSWQGDVAVRERTNSK